jgi:hypothetical protein
VLKTFALDETTGDAIPEKPVKALNASRDMFAAIESSGSVDAFYDQHTKALERADHERIKKAKMLPREVRPPWPGG